MGKTTAAIGLAHELGWGLVEMNASDARNRSSIEEVAGRASQSNAFSVTGPWVSARKGEHTLILLDEADCLFSRDTEGAVSEPAPRLSFREFLRTRYGTVEALAKSWGLGTGSSPPAYAEWADVPVAGGRTKALRLPPAQRDLADWSETKVRTDLTDRGGLGAIAKLVRDTRQPVVLTVNDPTVLNRYSPVFRTNVARISFWPLREEDLRAVLRRVATSERIQVAPTALEAIVRRSRGDLRAALNDLDAVSSLAPGPAQEALLSNRDVTSDFFDFTREVFDRPRLYRSVEVRNRLDATPDDLLPWMEENLPRSTRDPATRLAAYQELAGADLLLSRARRFRAYGLWSYASELMTGGVGLVVASGGGHAPDRVAFPQFLGAMGRSRAVRALRTSVQSKAGRLLHLSRRKAGETAMDFLALAFRDAAQRHPSGRERTFARQLVQSLSLTAEEVAYLTGGLPDDARVRGLVDPEEPPPEPAPRRARPTAPPPPAEDAEPPSTPSAPGPSTKSSRKTQRRLADF